MQPHDRVELRRPDRPTDFWMALEAAQYARVTTVEPGLPAEGIEAATAFLARFEECATDWEELSAAGQQLVLEQVADDAKALAAANLSVYVGTLERNFAPPGSPPAPMPLAVVHVGPAGAEGATIDLPRAMQIATG